MRPREPTTERCALNRLATTDAGVPADLLAARHGLSPCPACRLCLDLGAFRPRGAQTSGADRCNPGRRHQRRCAARTASGRSTSVSRRENTGPNAGLLPSGPITPCSPKADATSESALRDRSRGAASGRRRSDASRCRAVWEQASTGNLARHTAFRLAAQNFVLARVSGSHPTPTGEEPRSPGRQALSVEFAMGQAFRAILDCYHCEFPDEARHRTC